MTHLITILDEDQETTETFETEAQALSKANEAIQEMDADGIAGTVIIEAILTDGYRQFIDQLMSKKAECSLDEHSQYLEEFYA